MPNPDPPLPPGLKAIGRKDHGTAVLFVPPKRSFSVLYKMILLIKRCTYTDL
jgi:hypothetical protein